MNPGDTEIGGADRRFRTTMWTEIQASADETDPRAREHLDRLFRAYWKPVYAYIRVYWRASNEDAKDLTQAFFSRLFEKEYWTRVRREDGSFRGYLKKSLQHFLINAKRHDAVRKPDTALLPLDAAPEELGRIASATGDAPPEQAFDREWVRCVMNDAIRELRKFLEREDKKVYFELFHAYCVDEAGEGPGPTYREMAERHRLDESQVRNYLGYARKKLKAILLDKIREYVTSENEVAEELKRVIGE